MAQTLIDTTAQDALRPESQVIYDSDTVYQFYQESTGQVSYRVLDADGNVGSEIRLINNTGALRWALYYERWNAASRPPVVHVVAQVDAGTRGAYYANVNLQTGIASATSLVTTMGSGPGTVSLGVALNGNVHVVTERSAVYQHYYSSNNGGSWTSLTAPTIGSSATTNFWILPDHSTGTTEDLTLVRQDLTGTDELRMDRYDFSANTWSGDTLVETATDFNVTQGNVSVIYNRQTGRILYAVFKDDATPNTLETGYIYGTTVTAGADVVSSEANANAVALTVLANGKVRALYGRGAAGSTMRVYYKDAPNDTMASWGSEQGPYSTADATISDIMVDPAPLVGLFYPTYRVSNEDIYIEAPASTSDPTQYRLMLSDGVDPDIPVYNITPLNVGKSGAMLTRFERGRERAVIGEPPRAGALSTRVKNDSTALGYTGAPSAAWTLDEPAPGLAVRLNKSLDGGTTWSHMAQGNIDTIQHHFGADGFRSLIDIRANGPFAKLAGKKVTTSLYQDITTGAAIDIILDEAGFPDHLRDIATGVVTLEWWWLSDTDAMSAIVQLVNTEGLTADLFEAGDGKITFRDRNARYTDSRSATAQSTFTSEGSEPRFTGFDYTPGFREIVNEAKATRYRLTVDPAPSSTTVWEDGDGISYIVPPNGTLVVEATTTLPVSGVITPVSGTDYTVGLGSATATLNRVSGSRFTITYTNSDGLGATLANLQLRANTQYIQHGPIEEVSGGLASVRVDVDDSIAAYGLRPWQGSMWAYIGHADMRDNLDVITTVKKDPRAWVRIGLNAEGGSARNTATAERELGDRIRIINSNPGVEFNEFCWIERIEHEVQAPEREITFYECTPITGALGTNPYDDITNGAGVDTSDEGGSATGTGSTGSSGSSSPSPIALYGFAAGNQLTTFNGIQRITGGDATNIANLIAAGADNAKILVDNGVSITLTSQLVLSSFAKLYVPHGGSASISGGSLAGAAIYLDGATDVLIGGLNITSAPGDYTSSNNPASAIEITGASDRIQIVGTTITSPTFGGAVTDAPEGVNIWNNGVTVAAGPGSVTFYRVYWPVAGAGNSTAKSKGVIAGGTTIATRNALTFYECVFSAWQRLPFVQDGAIADIVNCVYPNIDRIDAIEVADGGEARARASVFRNSTDGSHAWETRNLGGGYIAAGPQVNDYQNSATFTEVSPSQVFTVPYSLTVNTTDYVDANVESNVGAGSVIIPE